MRYFAPSSGVFCTVMEARTQVALEQRDVSNANGTDSDLSSRRSAHRNGPHRAEPTGKHMEVPPDVEPLVPHEFFSTAKHVFVRSFSGREPFHHVREHRRHRNGMDHVVALHPHGSVAVSGDVLRTKVRRGSAATARTETKGKDTFGILTL